MLSTLVDERGCPFNCSAITWQVMMKECSKQGNIQKKRHGVTPGAGPGRRGVPCLTNA